MEKKFECPNGIPEEMCDNAPHCNVWKLRGCKEPSVSPCMLVMNYG